MRHRGDDEKSDKQADPAVSDDRAGQYDRKHRALMAETLGHEFCDRAHRARVLHQLAEQGAEEKIGKNCMTNWAALAMKVCVQCASNGSPASAAARIAAAGASRRMLQPR